MLSSHNIHVTRVIILDIAIARLNMESEKRVGTCNEIVLGFCGLFAEVSEFHLAGDEYE